MQQLLSQIHLVVACLGFFITLLVLIVPGGRGSAAWLLAIFIAIQSNTILLHLRWEFLPFYQGLLLYEVSIYLLLGPLLYGYTRLLISEQFVLRPLHLVHASASAAIGTAITMLWVEVPGYQVFIAQVWLAVYAAAALKKLIGYQKSIYENFSTLDNLSLVWLFKIVTFCLAVSLFCIVASFMVMVDIISPDYAHLFYRFWSISLFILIAMAGCRSHLLLFNCGSTPPSKHTSVKLSPISTDEGKYRNALLDQETASALCKDMHEYMEDQEPFLDSELKMPDLAARLGVSPHALSQVLNTVERRNFYEFVNSFRVSKARELILNRTTHGMSMEDIAMESGFGSKTTFYRHFKARFSMTPTEYEKGCIANIEKLSLPSSLKA